MTTLLYILGGVILLLIIYVITSKNDDNDQNKGDNGTRGPEDMTVWKNGFPVDGQTIH